MNDSPKMVHRSTKIKKGVKKTKKILAFILAVITVLSLGTMACASYYPPAAKSDRIPGTYAIYNVHGYTTPYFNFEKEYRDTFGDAFQKKMCLEYMIDSLNVEYKNVLIEYRNESSIDAAPMEEWYIDGQTEVFEYQTVDPILNYDATKAICAAANEKYTAENGYQPIADVQYGLIMFAFERGFDGKTNKPKDDPNSSNKEPNALLSFFQKIIQFFKNLFAGFTSRSK